MGMTMRASLPGYDCLTDSDIRHYSLYADTDNVLIKEQSRGAGSVTYGNTGTVTHSLGYLPFYLAYTEIGSGRYRIANSFDPVGSGWQVYTDTSKLYFDNIEDPSVKRFKYYIFYDNMEQTL